MTWLQWLAVLFGMVLVIALDLRAIGTKRWGKLIRTHTGELESGRLDARGRLPAAACPRPHASMRMNSGADPHPCSAASVRY